MRAISPDLDDLIIGWASSDLAEVLNPRSDSKRQIEALARHQLRMYWDAMLMEGSAHTALSLARHQRSKADKALREARLRDSTESTQRSQILVDFWSIAAEMADLAALRGRLTKEGGKASAAARELSEQNLFDCQRLYAESLYCEAAYLKAKTNR